MAVQARLDIDNVAFILSGDTLVREDETISRIIGRAVPIEPKTVMAKNGTQWLPLDDIDPIPAPATCTTGALGTDLAGFQAVVDGEFSIPVDGHDIELATLNFSVISTPLDTPATATCGANGDLLAAWQAVADGEFRIPINGVNVDVIGCNFTGIAALTEIDDVINAISVPLGARVIYDAVGDVFTFVTTLTGQLATLGVLVAVPGGAGTDISGVAGPGGFLNGAAAALVAGVGGIYGVTIADVINAAAAGRFRVEHDALNDTMVFISPTTGQVSAIGPLEPLAVPVGTPIEVAGFLNGEVGTAVLAVATGFDDINLPAGIYVGDEIAAATVAAADVTNCPILVGGNATINSGEIVLEGALTLATVIPTMHKTIEDVLLGLGLTPEDTIDIASHENV